MNKLTESDEFKNGLEIKRALSLNIQPLELVRLLTP